MERKEGTYEEPLVLTEEDRAFLSAIQDPEKRQQVIEILLGEEVE